MAKQVYIDIYGRSHVASKILSSGGQGIVYKTEEPNTLLKLEWNPITQEIVKETSNNAKFDEIRIFPILEKTNITLPQTTLKDVAGYTMKLLDDMNSFEEVFSNCGGEIPCNDWLDGISATDSDLGEKFVIYISSGGIRKRIEAYLKSACILAKIHASGLVYCDVSDKNMFVSKDVNKTSVWFIDCDNLDYMRNTTKRSGWITPGFGAPEIYRGKGNTMYSDVYSFAISLFLTLTGKHPFMGEAVEEALEEQDMLDGIDMDFACSGDFAWIGDEDDDSNHTEIGMPYTMFLSDSLTKCFERTFSEEARHNKQKRVTMPEWGFVLARELDNVIRCSHCQMDYYAHSSSCCPWCDSNNKVIRIKSRRKNSEGLVDLWEFVHEKKYERINVPLRIMNGFNCNQIDEYAFQVDISNDKLKICDFSSLYDFYIVINENEKIIYGETTVNTEKNINLICKKNSVRIEIEIEVGK